MRRSSGHRAHPAHADATLTKTITVDCYGILPALAFTPNGTQVYVTNANHDSVSVIDVATGTVSTTIAVGSGPVGVAFSPNGAKVAGGQLARAGGTSGRQRRGFLPVADHQSALAGRGPQRGVLVGHRLTS